MKMEIEATNDPALRSWVESANHKDADFPIQNLPFGVFRRMGSNEVLRGGVAIGDCIVDLQAAAASGLFTDDALIAARAASQPSLNVLMALDPHYRIALRIRLSQLLREGAAAQETLRACLVQQDEAEYALPAQIGDFADFYSSLNHATNVGALYRPDNPVLPNFKWLPVGYHGRSSSIRVSGQDVLRPQGQLKAAGEATPVFAPSRRLDYEAELGILVGKGNPMGQPVPADDAENRLFGMCILNDWSARDIQSWEYQPLGPFLGKSFLTTLSPWVVTFEALAPFRAGWMRPASDPPAMPHLMSEDIRERGAIDIRLEVSLQTQRMREEGIGPKRISLSRYTDAYWTVAQLVAHYTSNGCNLLPGDLLGSGTISGPDPESLACLLELSEGGTRPLSLPTGETRTFLEDGDTVVMRAWCERPGKVRIGFGECIGTVISG